MRIIKLGKKINIKKRILVVFEELQIGGSTTSLISLLNNIDYQQFDVDLLLYRNSGDFDCKLPKELNILKEANVGSKFLKFTKSLFYGDFFKSLYFGFKTENKIKFNKQALSYVRVTNSRRIKKIYDVAIGFQEGWANNYVALKSKAHKKIGWIHPDPKDSKTDYNIDRKVYNTLDTIVLVSKQCNKNFKTIYPKYGSKSLYIPNILSQDYIRELSKVEVNDILVDPNKINLVTVCRIDFKSKGLDRAVKVFGKIINRTDVMNLCWYIIGDGIDMTKLKTMIKENNLDDYIKVLGSKNNPLPYVKKMDLFFLPSRYEGKPMAVTESLMLGIPAIVTKYASANEQINHGIDGIVINNDIESIMEILLEVNMNFDYFKKMKDRLIFKDYSNLEALKQIYKLIDN